MGNLATQNDEADRLNTAMRDQMVRTMGLVQGVLEIDNTYYQSRHQSQNPANEDAEPQEAFYHDFVIGAEVIDTLTKKTWPHSARVMRSATVNCLSNCARAR